MSSGNVGSGVGGAAGTRRRLQLLAAQRQQTQQQGQRWARPRQRAAGAADDNSSAKGDLAAPAVAVPRDVTPPRDAGPWAQPPAPCPPSLAAVVQPAAAVPERSPPYAPGLGSTLMVLRRMHDLERVMGNGMEGGGQAPGQQGTRIVVDAGEGGGSSPGRSSPTAARGGEGVQGQQGPGGSLGGSPGRAQQGQRGSAGVRGQLGPGGDAALEEARRRAATAAVHVPPGAALYRGLPEVEAEPREQARWGGALQTWNWTQSAC